MQSIGGRRLLAVTGSALAAAALLAVAGWMLLGGGGNGGSPSADDAAIQIIPPGEALPDGGVSGAHSAAGAAFPGSSAVGVSGAGAALGQYPGAAFPGSSVAGAEFPGASSAQQAGAASDPAYPPAEIAVYITGAVARPGVYRVAFGERLDAVIARAGGASEDADLSRINLAAYVKDAAHYRIPSVGSSSDGAAGDGSDTAATAASINASTGAVNGSAVGAGGVGVGAVNAGGVGTGEFNPGAAGAGMVSAGGVNINEGGAGAAGVAVCAAPIDINSATPDCLQTLPGIGRVRAETIVAHREEEGPFPSVKSITAVSGIGEGIYGRIAGLITARPR